VRHSLAGLLKNLVGALVTLQVFFIVYGWIAALSKPGKKVEGYVHQARDWLNHYHLLVVNGSVALDILLVILLILLFKSGRNLLVFVFSRIWKIMGALPGKQTLALLQRYLTIARFCRYERQEDIFTRLCNQYPAKTGFILLPMDMAYMDAGTVEEPYATQMEGLARIKSNHPDTAFPFVFIDPRRMQEEKESFFAYTFSE